MGHAFAVRPPTGRPEPAGFCPFALREVSVLAEPASGHLRYDLTDVPPQSNSPPGAVPGSGRGQRATGRTGRLARHLALARGRAVRQVQRPP